jgi:DNA primase large subunit
MNHKERITLALFLMQRGKSDKEIMKRFSHFFDFNKNICKEQINYLRRMRRGY